MWHGKHTHKAELSEWMAPSALEEWWHSAVCVLTYLVGGKILQFQPQPQGYNSNFTCHLNFSKRPLKTEEYIVLESLNNFNVCFSN